MTESVFKNFVFRNMCDILIKMHKMYPQLMTDEIINLETAQLKQYINPDEVLQIAKEPRTEEQEHVPPPVIPAPAKASSTSIQCLARVIPSSTCFTDYVSYDATNQVIYGRQCKNFCSAGNNLCVTHKKKAEHGLINEAPTEKVKEICKYKCKQYNKAEPGMGIGVPDKDAQHT